MDYGIDASLAAFFSRYRELPLFWRTTGRTSTLRLSKTADGEASLPQSKLPKRIVEAHTAHRIELLRQQ
ncbi:MAG TPA: hypothetical protein VF618_03400 [Thermoanaerobaculia bacterium]